MCWHHNLLLRFRSHLRRNKADQEFNNELKFHLQQQTNKCIPRRLTWENARAAALRRWGGMEQIKEECQNA